MSRRSGATPIRCSTGWSALFACARKCPKSEERRVGKECRSLCDWSSDVCSSDLGAYGFEHVNVAAQRRDPDSLLNWMERAFRMRKEVPEIGRASCRERV